MVTKKQIADLIIAQKNGGNSTIYSKVDERDVFALCDIVVGALVAQEYERNRSQGNYTINSDWVSTYVNVPIYMSKSRKEKYALLPAKPISLPGCRAIRLVCPMEAQDDPFNLIDGNARGIYKNLEAGALKRVAYPEGNKIFFSDIPDKCCDVMVKMIAGTEGLDENVAIPIPGITQQKLYEEVSAMLETQVRYRTKMINDSNPNTV